ncbi:hypothetical protein [Phorcysia thermohydrogeniphila]|uniref:Uncharacterized protein n=1 Tax=Phorcysia thermohydrogeniphila TaxID=936138 RepID=A0A4R1G760_9BACT|nr:hypothetical protein [Phorcysia thermohydrogeniphila]TCK02501.1 hypothetical protein CLV27_1677 [Phorcysia thermohydrogeniphila]
MGRKILLATLITGLLSFGSCSSDNDVCLLTDRCYFAAPFEASKFTGFLTRKYLKVHVDIVQDRNSLIKFLNLSRYNAFITDTETAKFITGNNNKWVLICRIAVKRPASPLKTYSIVVNSNLLRHKEILINLIESWNRGVDLLKDPAVQKVIFKNLNIRADGKLKLVHCTG